MKLLADELVLIQCDSEPDAVVALDVDVQPFLFLAARARASLPDVFDSFLFRATLVLCLHKSGEIDARRRTEPLRVLEVAGVYCMVWVGAHVRYWFGLGRKESADCHWIDCADDMRAVGGLVVLIAMLVLAELVRICVCGGQHKFSYQEHVPVCDEYMWRQDLPKGRPKWALLILRLLLAWRMRR